MDYHLSSVASPRNRGPRKRGGGGRGVDGSLPTVPTDLQEPANKLADPANKLAEFQAQQVMGDGLLRVAEKRAVRRMEPSDEGEGMLSSEGGDAR